MATVIIKSQANESENNTAGHAIEYVCQHDAKHPGQLPTSGLGVVWVFDTTRNRRLSTVGPHCRGKAYLSIVNPSHSESM